jgi:hypothetical protein
MEKKRNNLLLASTVFGIVFAAGILTFFWVNFIRGFNTVDLTGIGFITGLINLLQDKSSVLIIRGIILGHVIFPLSVIFNLIGWNKGSGRHTVIGGILYVLCLNLISAPLCIVEYICVKREIKNKLLLYTMIYTLILNGALIALFLVTDAFEAFGIYFLSTAAIAGLILNVIAWKTNNKEVRIIAGFVYILGLLTVPSAVMCFISSRGVKPRVKNALLFYTMTGTLIFNGGIMASPLNTASIDPVSIYVLSATMVGLILNVIAWKTNNKKVKITAGIAYVLGIFTVISAVMCFISCKGSRKLPDAEGKSANGVAG